MKHLGMFVLIQRFVIKKGQNSLLPGTSPHFPLDLPATGSFDFMIGVLGGPGTWGLEAGT